LWVKWYIFIVAAGRDGVRTWRQHHRIRFYAHHHCARHTTGHSSKQKQMHTVHKKEQWCMGLGWGRQKGNGPVGWEQEVGGGKAREQPATTPTHNRAPCGVQCCGSCWTHCLPRPPTEKNTGEKRKGHRMGCEKSGKGKESAMWFARIAPDKTMATSLPRGQKGMEEGSRNPNPNPNSPACALRPRPSRLPCWRARRRRSGG